MKGNKHVKTITNIIYAAFALFAVACFAVLPSGQDVIIARQQKQIEALTAGLRKVSAQLELNKRTQQNGFE
jgi:hypothetical protein